MDEQLNESQLQRKPRRRRRTQMEIIKEAYLPYIFLMTAVLLIVIFIIGALVRGNSQQAQALAALIPVYFL